MCTPSIDRDPIILAISCIFVLGAVFEYAQWRPTRRKKGISFVTFTPTDVSCRRLYLSTFRRRVSGYDLKIQHDTGFVQAPIVISIIIITIIANSIGRNTKDEEPRYLTARAVARSLHTENLPIQRINILFKIYTYTLFTYRTDTIYYIRNIQRYLPRVHNAVNTRDRTRNLEWHMDAVLTRDENFDWKFTASRRSHRSMQCMTASKWVERTTCRVSAIERVGWIREISEDPSPASFVHRYVVSASAWPNRAEQRAGLFEASSGDTVTLHARSFNPVSR